MLFFFGRQVLSHLTHASSPSGYFKDIYLWVSAISVPLFTSINQNLIAITQTPLILIKMLNEQMTTEHYHRKPLLNELFSCCN
jgi:hypothetical protein